jgi:DNA-binding MarR family transcriptional regulator
MTAGRRASPPPSVRVTRLEEMLPYLMNRLAGRLNRNLAGRLRRLGYSFQEWRVIAVLAARDGMTLSQLTEATMLPQPTLSRLAQRLERRGFLRRQASARDSRFVHARLTPQGRAAYRRMWREAVAEYRAAVGGFDAAETAALVRAMRRMIANVGIELWVDAPGCKTASSRS